MFRPVQRLFYGWRVVAVCFVISAVACSLCLFGSSVYLQALTALHGWPITGVASAITVYYLVSAASQRTVGRSIDRWGARPILLIGTLSMSLGVGLTGQVNSPWQLYPAFALIGLGWACLSTTGISATVAPWFERHQGRSVTLALTGASLGAIAGVPILLLSIRELGVSAGLLSVAIGATLILAPLIGVVLRHQGPAQLGLRRDGDLPSPSNAASETANPIANERNRRRLLWSTMIAFALALMMQVGFITHHVTLAAPLLGTIGAGWLVSAGGLAAFIGRLVLARHVDRLDVRRLAMLIMLAQAASLLLMSIWPGIASLLIGSIIYGYGIGHITTLGPVIVRREFGSASFGQIYGGAATLSQFSTAMGPLMLGALRDTFGSYQPGLIIAAILTTIAGLILWAGKEKPSSAAPTPKQRA